MTRESGPLIGRTDEDNSKGRSSTRSAGPVVTKRIYKAPRRKFPELRTRSVNSRALFAGG